MQGLKFSAKQYIQTKVMEEAKRLLVYTDFPIADIAFELCFCVHRPVDTNQSPSLYHARFQVCVYKAHQTNVVAMKNFLSEKKFPIIM